MSETSPYSATQVYEMTGLTPTGVGMRVEKISTNDDGLKSHFAFGHRPTSLRGEYGVRSDVMVSEYGMYLLLRQMLDETDTIGGTGNVSTHSWLRHSENADGEVFELKRAGSKFVKIADEFNYIPPQND